MTSPPLPAAPPPPPLVAPREDTTRATSGIALIETGDALHDAIASGSWRDGALAGLGFGIELAAAALDPLGVLAAAGIGWLMEHVRPLSDLLDGLTGDPDAVAAQARTWHGVAVAVRAAGEEMGRATAPGDDWTGDAADAFTRAGTARAEEIRASAVVADALGAAVEGAGALVSLVREVVRELIAQLVATLVVRVPQWALEEVGTLGLATPHVVASAVAVIAKVTKRVVGLAEGLVRSLRRLGDLVSELLDLARRLGARGPAATPAAATVPARATPASATARVASDAAPAHVARTPAQPFGPGTGTRPTTSPAEGPQPTPPTAPRAPAAPPDPPLPPEQRAALAQRFRAALEPEPPTRPAATPRPLGDQLPPVAPGTRTLREAPPETGLTRDVGGRIQHLGEQPYRGFVQDHGRARAEGFRSAHDPLTLSAKSVGKVSSVAFDRVTGRLVESTNGRPSDVIELDALHPILERRLTDLVGPGQRFEDTNADGTINRYPDGSPVYRDHPHPDEPLRHAEVKAVNELLHHRDALRAAGHDVPPAALGDIVVDNYYPFRGDGVSPAPCCANCSALLRGIEAIPGHFDGFPPSGTPRRSGP